MHKGSQDLANRKGIIAFQAELRKELKDGDGHAFGQKASIYKQTIQDIDSVSSWICVLNRPCLHFRYEL